MLKTEASSCDRLMNKKLDNVTLTTGVPPLRNEAKKKKKKCLRKKNELPEVADWLALKGINLLRR